MSKLFKKCHWTLMEKRLSVWKKYMWKNWCAEWHGYVDEMLSNWRLIKILTVQISTCIILNFWFNCKFYFVHNLFVRIVWLLNDENVSMRWQNEDGKGRLILLVCTPNDFGGSGKQSMNEVLCIRFFVFVLNCFKFCFQHNNVEFVLNIWWIKS